MQCRAVQNVMRFKSESSNKQIVIRPAPSNGWSWLHQSRCSGAMCRLQVPRRY